MEEIENIFQDVHYMAVYDPETFRVLKVGPSSAFNQEEFKIVIDQNLALEIIEGKIYLHHCYIDIDSESLELTEKQYLTKIDDVLHRIVEKKWNKNKYPDIFLTYLKNKKTIKIQLTSVLGGTRKINKKNNRKISLSGDTVMDFYFTEYNDPHKLISRITLNADEILGKNFERTNVELPARFSVYTRRIYKGYVLEIR